jgi:hypothetical protein
MQQEIIWVNNSKFYLSTFFSTKVFTILVPPHPQSLTPIVQHQGAGENNSESDFWWICSFHEKYSSEASIASGKRRNFFSVIQRRMLPCSALQHENKILNIKTATIAMTLRERSFEHLCTKVLDSTTGSVLR